MPLVIALCRSCLPAVV